MEKKIRNMKDYSHEEDFEQIVLGKINPNSGGGDALTQNAFKLSQKDSQYENNSTIDSFLSQSIHSHSTDNNNKSPHSNSIYNSLTSQQIIETYYQEITNALSSIAIPPINKKSVSFQIESNEFDDDQLNFTIGKKVKEPLYLLQTLQSKHQMKSTLQSQNLSNNFIDYNRMIFDNQSDVNNAYNNFNKQNIRKVQTSYGNSVQRQFSPPKNRTQSANEAKLEETFLKSESLFDKKSIKSGEKMENSDSENTSLRGGKSSVHTSAVHHVSLVEKEKSLVSSVGDNSVSVVLGGKLNNTSQFHSLNGSFGGSFSGIESQQFVSNKKEGVEKTEKSVENKSGGKRSLSRTPSPTLRSLSKLTQDTIPMSSVEVKGRSLSPTMEGPQTMSPQQSPSPKTMRDNSPKTREVLNLTLNDVAFINPPAPDVEKDQRLQSELRERIIQQTAEERNRLGTSKKPMRPSTSNNVVSSAKYYSPRVQRHLIVTSNSEKVKLGDEGSPRAKTAVPGSKKQSSTGSAGDLADTAMLIEVLNDRRLFPNVTQQPSSNQQCKVDSKVIPPSAFPLFGDPQANLKILGTKSRPGTSMQEREKVTGAFFFM